MTAFALITGTIFRQPESRMSKAGKPFVMASIKVRDGADATFWRVFAFGETAQAELMRLNDGDAIAVQGAFKVEIYQNNGVAKPSLSITADQVLAARQPPKKREAKPGEPKSVASDRRPAAGAGAEPGLNDDIPF